MNEKITVPLLAALIGTIGGFIAAWFSIRLSESLRRQNRAQPDA